jgi:microcystin-dependent protein
VKKATGAFAAFLYTTSAIGATLLPNGQQQFVDATGKPYANGKVYFYTNTPTCTVPKNTYTKPEGSTCSPACANANPVILDGAGRATIFGEGAYCQVLKDANNTTIWTKYTSDTSSASNLGWGGTSGGTGNAQSVSVTGFNFINGQTFYFVAGYLNTSAATLSVNGSSPVAVVKTTPSGTVALSGGEIVPGNVVGVTYSLTSGNFQLVTNNNTLPGYAGEVRAFASGGACPGGWVYADGATVLISNYPNLYSAIGTNWNTGPVAPTEFMLPDLRNQFLRGDGASVVGTIELNQNKSHTHTATSVVTDPGHTHGYTYSTVAGGAAISSSAPTPFGNANVGGTTSSYTPTPPGITVATTNAANGGTETRPDNKRVRFCVKY